VIAPRSNRSPRRALLALAFGLSLLLAWGLARDTEPEHRCAGTEWEDGWCETCARGYLAGMPIPSQIVFDALDAHGHDYELDRIECPECRAAIPREGFCTTCKLGYWQEACYFSQLSYQVARAERRDAGDCEGCRELRGRSGWCEASELGWIGEVAISSRPDYEKAEAAYLVLVAALDELERCELCAASMAIDGICPSCWIAYDNGVATPRRR